MYSSTPYLCAVTARTTNIQFEKSNEIVRIFKSTKQINTPSAIYLKLFIIRFILCVAISLFDCQKKVQIFATEKNLKFEKKVVLETS